MKSLATSLRSLDPFMRQTRIGLHEALVDDRPLSETDPKRIERGVLSTEQSAQFYSRQGSIDGTPIGRL